MIKSESSGSKYPAIMSSSKSVKSATSALINLADESDDPDNSPMKAVESHSLFKNVNLLLEGQTYVDCNEKEKLLLFVESSTLHPFATGLIGWVNTIITEVWASKQRQQN
eukprot:15365499-Ditylum_brightwellii.AAC.2